MTNSKTKRLLETTRMLPDSLPPNIEAEDGQSGVLLSTARISENIRFQTDEKGWDFLKRF